MQGRPALLLDQIEGIVVNSMKEAGLQEAATANVSQSYSALKGYSTLKKPGVLVDLIGR